MQHLWSWSPLYNLLWRLVRWLIIFACKTGRRKRIKTVCLLGKKISILPQYSVTFAVLRSCCCLPWQSWTVTHWLVAEPSVWFFNFLCFITKYGFHLESTKLRNVAFPAPFFPSPKWFLALRELHWFEQPPWPQTLFQKQAAEKHIS